MTIFNVRRRLRNCVVHTRTGHAGLRLLKSSEVFITENTELVIEGYPRSGNSFAEAAIRFAQNDRHLHLAHHTHSAGHVLEAIRRDLPVLLLFRDPIDAAASFMEECQGSLSASVALWEYVQFHEPLLKYEHKLVLGHFQTLTTQFPALIHRVNQRFGCHFRDFEHTPETVKEIRKKVDEISLARAKLLTRYSIDQDNSVQTVRRKMLERFKDELRGSAELAAPREKALSMFQKLCRLESSQFRGAA